MWDGIRDYLRAYAARERVAKVAVVGNAPLAPDAARAAEIDSSDLVLRTNAMMLDEPGGTPCLGRACHAVLMSRSTRLTPWTLHDYRRRAYLVPQAGFVVWRNTDVAGLQLDAPHWPQDLGYLPLPNSVVKTRLLAAMDPHLPAGSVIPTTGTMAMFLGHEMFADAEMVVSGFSFLDDATVTHWAHHSGASTRINPLHRLDLEAALLQSWIDDGSVRFLR